MHERNEPTIPANETDPLRKGRLAGDEDLDFEEVQEPEDPEKEDPAGTEYPGGDGEELPAPGGRGA